MSFATLISGLSFFSPQNDDDAVDRLHYYYTSTVLLLSSVLFAFKVLAGHPLECWPPAEWTGAWESYAGVAFRNMLHQPMRSVWQCECLSDALICAECCYALLHVNSIEDAVWVTQLHYESYARSTAEMYCWARNTYFVPFEQAIPSRHAEREQNEVSYYQWTPFFLLVCAFAFYFPCIVWRLLNDKSGNGVNSH